MDASCVRENVMDNWQVVLPVPSPSLTPPLHLSLSLSLSEHTLFVVLPVWRVGSVSEREWAG